MNNLTEDEIKWLVGETSKAMDRFLPDGARIVLPDGAQCMIPKCGDPASGRLPLFSVGTRFSTELFLCDRCFEMITTCQIAYSKEE